MTIKNLEGFDRIPQSMIVDGCDIWIGPFLTLLKKIYYETRVPEQELVSKIIPAYKNKGDKKNKEP